jgi:hypothetical protein
MAVFLGFPTIEYAKKSKKVSRILGLEGWSQLPQEWNRRAQAGAAAAKIESKSTG